MVLCNIECIEKIARYLDVSTGKLDTSEGNIILASEYKQSSPIQGFSTIIQVLVRKSKYPDLLGNDKESRALAQQWLEYAIVCVNYADISVNARRVLNELNFVLKDVSYITGTQKTIADVTLYYALHSIMKRLNQQEKAQYIHVSRWFDNIQQEDKLRGEFETISFNLLHLFL